MASTCLKALNFIISLAIIALTIFALVWIFKVYRNADDEPTNRAQYYNEEDVSNYYIEGEFCYTHFQPYVQVGAFEDFDIRMDEIEKYSLAFIITNFIPFAIVIINIIGGLLCLICTCAAAILKLFACILGILNLVTSLLSFIFFIILSAHFYKSNFDDLEDFGNCEYMNKTRFFNDYDFAFIVEDNFKRFFIIYIIIIVLNIINILLDCIIKRSK